MIQASATLHQHLRDLRVQPEYERRLRLLIEHARRNLPAVDEDRIRRAFQVAYWAHRDDRRASGELYITHPLEVALIAAKDIRLDEATVIAALLHDTVEDTDVSLELIEAEFGTEVARITDGVTKIGHLFGSREMGHAENVRKLMLSMASDIRVILVKFADRLHNMRTLGNLPPEKRMQVSAETLDLFAPLAHRFGLHEMKTELEDLALKHLEPDSYRAIADGLQTKRRQRERFVDKFIGPVREELTRSGFEFEIYGRPKSIYSIYRKMRRQEKELDEIYDLFAIRVILHSEGRKGREDCWRAYSVLTDLYQPIPDRFRDFISTPKSNGYQSLHTTVLGPEGKPVEIQIRTAEMHEIAERGVAAHWTYKETVGDAGGDGDARPRRKGSASRAEETFAWVRDLLEGPGPEHAGEFVREFQLNLYDEEIYVFTPKGELMTLPRGATPVDFAYQVHTQVGFHCIGAKVNGRMVPLSHPLTSGDQVEILTSKKQTPNQDWMQFVVTSKARGRIRHFLNEKRRKAAETGQELLERRLRRARVSLDDGAIARVASRLKFPSTEHLYYEIGAGLYDPDDFVDAVNRGGAAEEAEPPRDTARLEVDRFAEDAREMGRTALVVAGERHTDLAVQYATCCSPIPGDEVFGYISRTGVVKIHQVSCRNAPHLMLERADRIIPVEWSRQKDVQFVAALRLIGEDRVGIVSDITKVISKNLKTNIRSITVEGEHGVFEGRIVLYVSGLDQLRRIMQRLARVDGIHGVTRLEEGAPAN